MFSQSLNVQGNETSNVLFAVCLLRNYAWSRNTLSQLEYDALIAVKDAVINNSCSWVSVMDAFKVWVGYRVVNIFSSQHSPNQFHVIIYQITAVHGK